jgi:hypothetical protein
MTVWIHGESAGGAVAGRHLLLFHSLIVMMSGL